MPVLKSVGCDRYQLMQALAFMHKQGYFHRDIKPENILVTRDTIKVADFGLAREIRSRPPYTDYVSTRWCVELTDVVHKLACVYVTYAYAGTARLRFYCAPSTIIARSTCLRAEPLWLSCTRCVLCSRARANRCASGIAACPCASHEACSIQDEIYKITSILGTPTAQTWAEGLRLAAAMNFKFAQVRTYLVLYGCGWHLHISYGVKLGVDSLPRHRCHH